MRNKTKSTSHYGKRWIPRQYYLNPGIASDYDRERFTSAAGRTFNALEKRLIRRAFGDLPTDAAIADVPCGTGRLAEVLLDMGFAVTGMDISPAMLDVATKRLSRFGAKFQPVVADAHELAKSTQKWDAALCARVLMHFPLGEQIDFLRNVTAVTRRRVVFTQGVDSAYHRIRRAFKRLLGHQPPAVYPLTRSDFRKLIAGAGLREVRRYALLPLISESLVIVAEPISAPKA